MGTYRITANHYLDNKNIPEDGNVCRSNLEFLREYKELDRLFGRNSAMLYFILTQLKVEGVRTMFQSSIKQRNFVKTMCHVLKRKSVVYGKHDYRKAISKDIELSKRRFSHVFTIIQENIKLTEYYPFFCEIGFERLLEFNCHSMDVDDQLHYLVERWDMWKANNQDKIAKHMKSVEQENENLRKYRENIAARDKAEKERKKEERKKETAYIREMRNNQKEYQKKVKLENTIYEYYCKQKGR